MSQTGAYSEDKMIWWMHREGFPPSGPKQVHWILSDLCNQDCSFCAYRMSGYTSNELFGAGGGAKLASYGHDNPVRWVDTDRALRLVDEFVAAGVLAVQFTGGGEPTVHPAHEDIFEKSLDRGLQCALVSNGYRWKDRIFDILPRFTWVRVSVDAGRPETYAAIRRTTPEAWGRVWRNISRLRGACGGDQRPYIGVGFVVTPDNYLEIPLFAQLAVASGADNIRFTAMFSPDNERPYQRIYHQVVGMIREVQSTFSARITIHDNFGSRYDDLVQREPDYPTCAYQHYVTYVGGDLNVYRCCILAYNRRGLVAAGDLTNQKFDDYWRSDARKADFAGFDARGCPRCQFNEKNRRALYVLGSTYTGPAKHVEFT